MVCSHLTLVLTPATEAKILKVTIEETPFKKFNNICCSFNKQFSWEGPDYFISLLSTLVFIFTIAGELCLHNLYIKIITIINKINI